MACGFITFNGIGKTVEEHFDNGKMDPEVLYEFYYEYAEEFLY